MSLELCILLGRHELCISLRRHQSKNVWDVSSGGFGTEIDADAGSHPDMKLIRPDAGATCGCPTCMEAAGSKTLNKSMAFCPNSFLDMMQVQKKPCKTQGIQIVIILSIIPRYNF